jgi:ABC-type dipeptide/oligopeptide/nickel transport system ATPase component
MKDMGVIFITHDMGVVAEMADRVLVMYHGELLPTPRRRSFACVIWSRASRSGPVCSAA